MFKNTFGAIAAISMIAVAAPAAAHPEGEYDARPQRKPIAQLAQDAIVKLVTQSKLPASWAKIEATSSKLRTDDGTNRWVVIFDNKQIRKASERKLYVTMTASGEFVSANYKPV